MAAAAESRLIDARESVDSQCMDFATGWTLFRLLVWVVIAVWVHPRLLDFVGGHGVAIWLERHVWIRALGVPPLGFLAILSAFELLDSPGQRAKIEALAQATGGAVLGPPPMDPTHGLPDGPRLRVPIGAWSMVVARWKRRDGPTTIVRVEVHGVTGFSFAAHDARNEPALLRGLERGLMGLAVDEATRRAGDSQAAAAAQSLAFLAEAPISIGQDTIDRLLVVRSNRPELARALFTAAGVAQAIETLAAQTQRWSWSLMPTGAGDGAQMELQCPRALADADSLRRVQNLMRAALEHLSEQRLIAA